MTLENEIMNTLKKLTIIVIVILGILSSIGCTEDVQEANGNVQEQYVKEDVKKYQVLEDGNMVGYTLTSSVTNIKVNSDTEVNILIVDDEYEYQRYIDGESVVHYSDYQAVEVTNYDREINMQIDDEMLVIENPSTFGIGDSANVEVTITVEYLA